MYNNVNEQAGSISTLPFKEGKNPKFAEGGEEASRKGF